MIRFDRGPEPASLAPIRAAEIARIFALGKEPTSDEIGKKYSVVRRELRKAQRFKCCYCETTLQESFNDVEHYRPKAKADRKPGSVETHGYWWLAWTWENLLFACPGCNRSGKRDRFPLDHGSASLVAQGLPPGGETPLVIDPADPNDVDPVVCNLGGDELIDLYRQHVQKYVQPAVTDLEDAVRSGDKNRVSRSWARMMKLLGPKNEFVALTLDAFEHLLSGVDLAAWGLALPRTVPLP